MSIRMSRVVATQRRAIPGFEELLFIDLAELGVRAAPLVVLDDFRVQALPFSAHPHAGFDAVTYVFEDSPGAVRSRTSTGADLTVGAGGIIWTHAGSGIVHEEVPAELGRELHGLQLFVNVTSEHKLSEPFVLHLHQDAIPEWHDDHGTRVRVVVGSFGGVVSSLLPPERFTFLDAHLHGELRYELSYDEQTVLYVLSGAVSIQHRGSELVVVHGGQAVAISGDRDEVSFAGAELAQVLVLTGRQIHDPVVEEGPFIMNDHPQIQAAIARYHSGQMGGLSPREGS